MKWSKLELDNLKFNSFHYSEDVNLTLNDLPPQLSLKSLKSVHVEGDAKYDSYLEALTVNLLVTGVMIIPCARTLVDVEYPYSISSTITYSFSNELDEDALLVKGNTIDTDPYIRDLIICEIPLQVFAKDSKPIENIEEKQLDPRLAKLKELKL